MTLFTLQGISCWNIFYDLTLTDKNMQARICSKVVLKSWDLDIWVLSTSFQKSNIGWPQQPLTERVLKFNMIFPYSTPIFFSSKHQSKAEFKNLDDTEVLSSDFLGHISSATSMTSMASTTSLASMTSTASFYPKKYSSWWLDHLYDQNDQYQFLFEG